MWLNVNLVNENGTAIPVWSLTTHQLQVDKWYMGQVMLAVTSYYSAKYQVSVNVLIKDSCISQKKHISKFYQNHLPFKCVKL